MDLIDFNRTQLDRIERKLQHMADIISTLASDFAGFQSDFATFVTNVQAALAKLAAGGLTPDQTTQLQNIDTAVQALDATVKGISFPS